MFDRQDNVPLLDDPESLPFVESVLTAFETAGIDGGVVEGFGGTPTPGTIA